MNSDREYLIKEDRARIRRLRKTIMVNAAHNKPTARVRVADKLRVAMRRSRLHVFDAQTEAAI